MKALSLTQPWASLVAVGAKRIETRSWRTSHTGLIAIHAAKGFPKDAKDLCNRKPFFSALHLEPAFLRGPGALPTAAIIAVCDLVACARITPTKTDYHPAMLPLARGTRYTVPPDNPELAFGDYTPGRHAWLLANVRRLETPIPCKGALSLWEVPASVEAQIRAQLTSEPQFAA